MFIAIMTGVTQGPITSARYVIDLRPRPQQQHEHQSRISAIASQVPYCLRLQRAGRVFSWQRSGRAYRDLLRKVRSPTPMAVRSAVLGSGMNGESLPEYTVTFS